MAAVTYNISGTKFRDLNGDGNIAGDPAGTPGDTFTIALYLWNDDGDGILESGELGALLAQTETNETNGTWAFPSVDLSAGFRYVVLELDEDGWTPTFPNSGGYYIIDPPATGTPQTVTLNFGNTQDFEDITISGVKYIDANGDGSILGDSPGTPGQTFSINLYKWVDAGALDGQVQEGELTLLDTTETNANTGAWSFAGLGALGAGEKYFVREVGETGWTQTFGEGGYIVAATSGVDDTDNNFGNFEDITIGGLKYTDENGDSDLTGDSPGTPGQTFTINLYKWVDAGALDGQVQEGELTFLDTTETNENTGAWSFTGLGPLAPGEKYFVREVGETGWTQTIGNAGYIITPTSGVDDTDNVFANTEDFENITISGVKYTDANGDGSILGDSPGTPGQTFTINLYKWVDAGALDGQVQEGELTFLDDTETDANTGAWAFAGLSELGAGEKYFVREAGETGWTQTFGEDGYIVAATSGVDDTDNNFGNFENITISGLKYTDTNGNGSIVGDSPGTPGQTFTINLYKWVDAGALDGQVQEGELTLLDDTETNANTGAWAFSNLGPLAAGEKYFVREVGETGWTQTFGDDGYIVASTSGADDTDNNFGNFEDITISGLKYTDANGDGSLIGDSPGTPGQTFTINLYKWVDAGALDGLVQDGELTLLDTTETDANTGAWSFTELGPLATGEKYFVREVGETGWIQTVGNNGYVVTPNSGADDTDNVFANHQHNDETCFSGLTRGAWGTPDNGAGNWDDQSYGGTQLTTSTSFEAIFGINSSWTEPGRGGATFASPTLLQALNINGGGANQLIAQATAALLNATEEGDELDHPYRFSADEIVAAVRFVYGYNDGVVGNENQYNATKGEALKTLLDTWNNAEDEKCISPAEAEKGIFELLGWQQPA